ncbi:hypothetical protein LSCM1_02743 [Leishmania martiniquensis]|uniref:ATP synthase regulation protein NCA2 n=1 Tax=Leishmania martiniquensis TaxID=1580590 RepID=A0A836KG44_9TRYP|nr:hypothetical protein LSCM1_02743 [Leishmania martiniquensis]
MNTHGVDVRTPIFYRHSFANALESQSSKAYARLTNTPLIAECLPRGAASGALIEQYAATHVHSLEDLEKLLRAVLDEAFGANASLHHAAVPMSEGGGGEPNTTDPSPPCVPLPRGAVASEDGVGEEVAAVSSAPIGGDADGGGAQPSHLRGGGEAAEEKEARRLPRSVSFLVRANRAVDSAAAAGPVRQEGSLATAASLTRAASPLGKWLPGCIGRLWKKGPLPLLTKGEPLPAGARPRCEDSDRATSLPRSTSNASFVTTASSTVARVGRARVPQWVRVPFAPVPTLSPAPVSINASAAQSMRWPRLPVPVSSSPLCEAAAASQRSEIRQNISTEPAAIIHTSQRLSVADRCDNDDAHCDRVRQEDEDYSVSSHLTQRPRHHSHGSLLAEGDVAGVPVAKQSTPARLSCFTAPTNVCETEGAMTAKEQQAHPPFLPDKVAPLPAATTGESAGDAARLATTPSPVASHHIRDHKSWKESSLTCGEQDQAASPLPLPQGDGGSSSRTSGGARGAFADLSKARLSFSFSHVWSPRDAHVPSISPTAKVAPKIMACAGGDCDKHACAAELAGWLHLLVWVRWQVIYFLRDLSGVQGFVAWSAWYWSWAQEHERQAAFHQALSSASFWRGVWSHGLHVQLSQVQYEMRRHMLTLKSVFQLIVSYIGAAYTALEQLNTLLMQVQRNWEVIMSPVAAAAAAAAAGSSPTAVPVSASYAYACRGGSSGGNDVSSRQNSMFWSPIVAGTMGGDASPLAPWLGDRAGSPHEVCQSAFASGTAQAAPSEHFGGHDEVERVSVNSGAGEDVAAALYWHSMDELSRAVWSMLQELKELFCTDGLPLDELEASGLPHFPWSGSSGDGLTAAGVATASIARPDTEARLHQPGANALFGKSALGEVAPAAQPSGPRARFTEASALGTRDGSKASEGQHKSAREGARVLLQCVHCSQLLLRRLTLLVQRSHSPPTGRHWRRILVAAVAVAPPFMWMYAKSPVELTTIAQRAVMLGRQLLRSYVINPVTQLRESLFYVRPGVEDRRGAVERDAASLANIIRDFHEDMYPNMPTVRLEELRKRTLERLRAGVEDPEGLGLIDEHYRQSVRHPIRSILFGHLPRIMLIQLSYQALEVSRVANGIDEVLEGNDLNFKIMAMMPVFLAGGLLATWALFRYRFKHKPVRLRMKLLWRSLFRVISFAGSGQGLATPFLRISEPLYRTFRHTEAATHVMNVPWSHTTVAGAGGWPRGKKGQRHQHSGAVAADAIWGSSLPPRNMEQDDSGGREDADTAAFRESWGDAASSSDESHIAAGGAAAARQLSNYEQGMVLLLSHVIRSTAAEYLRSYAFFHELMEDLNDLESVHSTRHQRLATLTRMRATHTYLF